VDLGESLVGAYLRHVQGCQVVVYNSFLTGQQGEIDVVGLHRSETGTREAWLCEVTTHIGGMLIVRKGRDATEEVLREKLGRLREFAALTFPDERHHFQWWSPYVPKGKVTAVFEAMAAQDPDFEPVLNEAYTARIQALTDVAGRNSSTTGEPAFRLLQMLTRLRGQPLQL